jgi:hypothetical protein
MTPRPPTGVQRGGISHRESSLLPISHLGVIYDSQPHGFALFYRKSGLELSLGLFNMPGLPTLFILTLTLSQR